MTGPQSYEWNDDWGDRGEFDFDDRKFLTSEHDENLYVGTRVSMVRDDPRVDSDGLGAFEGESGLVLGIIKHQGGMFTEPGDYVVVAFDDYEGTTNVRAEDLGPE